jgi:hypothetical protein
LIFLTSFAPLIHIVTESPSSSNPSPRAMRRLALSSHRDLYDLPQRRVSCPVLGLANFTPSHLIRRPLPAVRHPRPCRCNCRGSSSS